MHKRHLQFMYDLFKFGGVCKQNIIQTCAIIITIYAFQDGKEKKTVGSCSKLYAILG